MNNFFLFSRRDYAALLPLPLILLFAGKLLVYVPKLRFSSKYSEQLRSPQGLKSSGTPLFPPSTLIFLDGFRRDGNNLSPVSPQGRSLLSFGDGL